MSSYNVCLYCDMHLDELKFEYTYFTSEKFIKTYPEKMIGRDINETCRGTKSEEKVPSVSEETLLKYVIKDEGIRKNILKKIKENKRTILRENELVEIAENIYIGKDRRGRLLLYVKET